MYTQLVTGDVPGASTYFNPLLNQSIIPCTSGARPSSPTTGMVIYETDTFKYMAFDSTWISIGCSRRLSWTPQLTATTTNPTLGSGSTQSGWYTWSPGSVITCAFFIQFGTTGVNAGSGQYLISLPIASTVLFGTTGQTAMGTAILRDNSTSSSVTSLSYIPGSNPSQVALIIDPSGSVTNAAPWTWAAGDYLNGTITYPL